MDFIQNISPYWCTDPRLAAARLTQTTKQFLDVDEADPAVVVGGPDALLPVPTPAAYIRERKRMSVLFQLPFPYLPECIFQRGIHETIGDWRVRLTIALDMLGAIKYDDDGVPCYGALDGMPVTTDDLVKACIGFDGGEPFTYLETCDSVCEQVGRVWPGGYPLDDMKKGRVRHPCALCAWKSGPVGADGCRLWLHAGLHGCRRGYSDPHQNRLRRSVRSGRYRNRGRRPVGPRP